MSDKEKKVEEFDKISEETAKAAIRETAEEIQASEEDLEIEDIDEEDQENDDGGASYEEPKSSEEEFQEIEELEEDEDFEEDEDYDEEEFQEMVEEDEDIEILYDEDFEDSTDDVLPDDEDIFEKIEDNPELKKHRKKKKSLIIAAGILGALVLAYLAVALFFNSHFFIGTEINGTDFSGKSVTQVESYMEKQVDDYSLTLNEVDGGSEVIRGTDIDVQYVESDDLKKAKKKQNPLLWISFIWKKPEIETKVGVEYDKEKLNTVMASLDCTNAEGKIDSVSAVPVFQDTQFVIQDEVIGTKIDNEKFSAAVDTAISEFKKTLDLSKSGSYIQPKFTANSKEVAAAKDAMNKYLGANVTYDFNPHTEVVNASVISQWVTVDADMNVTFNEDAVRGYIQSLSQKYDTYGKNRTMVTANGNTVEVVGGSYGWSIDWDTEYQQLIANIQNAETVTREPAYSNRAVTHEGNDFGNTYVEIDLSSQHFWYFQNGQLIVESDIVTGNPNKGWDTPQGTYSLAYKQTDQVLRGDKMPDGSYEYESPVAFWMPFNGGIGLHDASWQPTFGGDRYLNYGSRGCINLPYAAASALYNNISAGTPVICHF